MRISLVAFIFFVAFSGVKSASGASEGTVSSPAWVSNWEKAKELEKQGAYLKAREIYEALVQEPSLGRKARAIRKEYQALQMKILFSKIETPESLFHTVEPGDTLYEIAKKYGTTVELLQKSNGISGDKIYPGMKLKVTRAKFSILVEKQANRLILFVDGKPLKTYKVATGVEGSTPEGTFKIINKLKDPAWFHAGAVVPPDHPGNILGSRWLGFDLPGYGIHGTTLPQTVGTQASKGCIRMLNTDVEEIYTLVSTGTEVVVKP